MHFALLVSYADNQAKMYSNHQRVEFEVVSEDELDKNAELVRHATPYPKDLKSKVIKLLPARNKSVKNDNMIENSTNQKPNFWKPYDEKQVHCASPVIDSGVSSAASPVNTTADKIEYNYGMPPQHNGITTLESVQRLKSDYSTDHSLDDLLSNHTHMTFFNIYVQRELSGLGISIAGGKGSTPYKGKMRKLSCLTFPSFNGIFVSKVTQGGPSDKGGLKVDDKILKVNDIPMMDVDHSNAVQILRNAGNTIKFTVLRQKVNIQSEQPNLKSNSTPHLNVQMQQLAISSESETASRNSNRLNVGLRCPNSTTSTIYNPRISYCPLNDTNLHKRNEYQAAISQQMAVTLPNTYHHQNKMSSFEPDMTSTPMSLSRASCKNTPDVVQSSVLNSLVHSASYDTKDLYDGPIVKVTVQNPRPYVPLTPELPAPTKALGDTSEVLTRSSYSETTFTRYTNNSLTSNAPISEEVTVTRLNGSLGLSIMGGKDRTCIPFGDGNGIYVSKIVPNGTAAKTKKKIRVGDRIIKVNDIDLIDLAHAEAVAALCESVDEVKLTIQHDPLPDGWQELSFAVPENEPLDEGIFITKILRNSAAEKDGRLKVGMRIIEVSNVSLLGVSLEEANRALNSYHSYVSFIVCTGNYNIPTNMLYSCVPGSSSVTIDSMPCIDSDDDSTDAFRPSNQDIVSHEKSVDERVLDVVRAAELLVNPTPRVSSVIFGRESTFQAILSSMRSLSFQKENSEVSIINMLVNLENV
ncbi:protein lap4 [Caerostris extrusa]|uniref:Protein lap4 n=1 Tax=Caerostris extrusa TaxID=172846 RepID=A0AAV4Y205_CAEEX|nr:protein lap4 [Caerostris extrusa]